MAHQRLSDAARPLRFAAAWLVALALAVGGMSWRAAAADDTVTLNFVNADIEAVIKAVAEITGRNFVVDPKVKGSVNIVSARPVPRSLVYPTLLSALRLQGFAAVEGDGVVKIVMEADAKQQGGPVATGPVAAGGDRLVTQVITLRYESAAQLVNVLRPLITPNNTIAAFPGNNALIITDYADNVKRIDRIVATLDQAPGGESIIVPVRHASAIDIVPMLNRLLGDQGSATGGAADPQQRVTLVADPRSNSVLVRADNPGRVARARQLIEQLDTPGRVGGNMYVIYLKHAEAARVAQTLRGLLVGGGESPVQAGGGLAATLSGNAAGTLAAGLATIGANGPAGSPFASSASNATSFSAGGATIMADTGNNALIIAAPEPVYNNLRAIIEKLDIRRAQVFVEALIVEVSADKAAQFGIQWQALSGIGRSGVQGIGSQNFGVRGSGNNIIDASANLGTVGQGLNIGIINGTITLPGIGAITNLAFLARALETDSNANILSTPTLLTLDNEEAKIIVGQNVPFITGQYTTAGTGAAVAPFQTVERKDVGLTLRVKPQITEGGSVRLAIYQEVSRVESQTNPAGIITNKRALDSTVIVDDNQIVVLGGLITDAFTDNSDKVPLIGDLPLLGALFRYDNRQRVKTNLMIFIKPTVVRRAATAASLTDDRYEYLMGEQDRLRPDPRAFWNDPTIPQLPPVGQMPGTIQFPASAPGQPPGQPPVQSPAPSPAPKPQ